VQSLDEAILHLVVSGGAGVSVSLLDLFTRGTLRVAHHKLLIPEKGPRVYSYREICMCLPAAGYHTPDAIGVMEAVAPGSLSRCSQIPGE
jgi:hypothetical protein